MTPEEINNIATELRRLGSELNLTDSQREQLRTFLTDKYEKLQEYKRQNPNLSKEDTAQYIAKQNMGRRNREGQGLSKPTRRVGLLWLISGPWSS
jgi:hypothetical protein